MAGLIVGPPDQIAFINKVQDYIINHPGVTVGSIKQRFNLTEDEYQMIYDYCMPCIRKRNTERYWIGRYKSVFTAFEELITLTKHNGDKSVSISMLEKALKKCEVSTKNPIFYNSFVEYEEDPEEDYAEVPN